MAGREVLIRVTGEGGQYTAMVEQIRQTNQRLYGDAQRGTQQTVTQIRLWENALGGIHRQLLGIISIGALIGFAKQALDTAGRLQDLSEQTGISARTLAGLEVSAKQSGLSIQEVTQGVIKMQKALVDSSEGTNDQAKAFARLFTAQERSKLATVDQEKFLALLAERLSAIPNQFERTALAMELAGRAGARLNPLLREIAEKGMAGIRSQAGPMSDDMVKALDDIGDSLSRLHTTGLFHLGGLIKAFAELLGLVQATKREKLIDELNDISSQSRGVAEQLRAALEARQKGLRSGIAQDATFNALQEKRNELLARSAEITKQLNEEGRKPAPSPLRATGDLDKQAQALQQMRIQMLQLNVATAEFRRNQGDLTVDVRAAVIDLFNAERAAALLAATHNKTLTPALRQQIEELHKEKIAQFDAKEAARLRTEQLEIEKRNVQGAAEAEKQLGDAYKKSADDLKTVNDRKLETIEIDQQIGFLQAERLQTLGQTTAAEQQRLQTQLKFLEQIRQTEIATGKDVRLRDEQIAAIQTKLSTLGEVTINVGQTISNALGDAFEGVILGTSKLADVGRNLMAALLRDASQFFARALVQKLGFENALLSNVRGFVPQLQSAAGGNGGFLSSIFGGAANGTGSAGLGIPGFSGGGGVGAGGGGGGFNLSTISSIGSFLSNTGSSIMGGFSTALSVLWLNPLTAILGAIITAVTSILGAQKPNPTVSLRARFSGFRYDELLDQFLPPGVRTSITGTQDISGGAAEATRSQVQRILKTQSQVWTDILNTFSTHVHDVMIPLLDKANRQLNQEFIRLKFSEGGSRSIQEELEILASRNAPGRFFRALRPVIGAGLAGSLEMAGLQVPGGLGGGATGFRFPWDLGNNAKRTEKFIESLQGLASLTASLARVSNQGVTPFLTDVDTATLQGGFDRLFTKGNRNLPGGFKQLQEQIGPVVEFLERAVGESKDIFGRGLIAALEAASESQAQQAWLQTLGEGTKDVIFKGITEAFIASAQFSDLLAPIQQTIRQFTQQAIETGLPPDLAAFRSALLPGVEQITTRGELLAPLFGLAQQIGQEITKSLGLGGLGNRPAAVITFNGPVSMNSPEDAENLLKRIDAHLDALLPPQ